MPPEHFLLGGAQRAGSTFLFHLLDQHPEISMARPLRPEPKFFLRADADVRCRRTYEALFQAKPTARLFGEKSTSYMERPDVAAKVLALLSEVKLVFLLRDPVERALSNYRFSVAHGAEVRSLQDAILDEDASREAYDRTRFSVSPFSYAFRGHYHRFIDDWSAAIGPERIHLIVFERLIADPTVVQQLLRFLGVSPEVELRIAAGSVNASGRDLEVPESIRRHLTARFEQSNRILQQRYGVDISPWQSLRTASA